MLRIIWRTKNSDSVKFRSVVNFILSGRFYGRAAEEVFPSVPGNEVRLMNAYFVKCESFVKDESGNITEIHCTYDPETKAGSGFTGRKVKGTIHWVPAPYAQKQR